jgi:hypothetical protein
MNEAAAKLEQRFENEFSNYFRRQPSPLPSTSLSPIPIPKQKQKRSRQMQKEGKFTNFPLK